jgi:hypothetical protein
VRAAEQATFGAPTATSTYGRSIEFRQPVKLTARPKRVEVLVDFPGAAGPTVNELAPSGGSLETTLRYELEVKSGDLLPNTRLSARWRVTAADGTIATGPPVSVTYEDTRFEWQTETGDLVRVHWYEGSDAFGRRALAIGEQAVRDTSKLLGVTETQPIDFFVYADQAAFYDALGPGTRENVGGQANAEIRTLFALIMPSEIDAPWVGIVIPHELTHLVFNTAVDNPYHFPPRWLNEGLAVYLSQGYDSGDRGSVEDAASKGTLMPLEALTGQFPTTQDRFFLAYAESVSSVDYLVRTYGRDALVSLIKSYARGLTDDEAFSAALGKDVAGFDKDWRTQLNAREPVVYGPMDAPAGPLPPGWNDASGQPGSGAGGVPGRSAGPTSPAAPTGTTGSPAVLAAALGVVLAAVIAVVLVTRRGRRRQV